MVLRRFHHLLAPLVLALAVGCADEATQLAEHQQRGDAYLEEEKYSEAIIEYKNVLQIDPNDPEAHYGLARAFLATKELRKAYWELQETARLDPQNFDARLQYGQFLLFGKEEELEEAVAQADAVLQEDADHAGAHVLRGRAMQALKRPDEAQAAFERAAELEPDDPGPLVLLANFHRSQGHREAAEPLFRQLTEIKPGFASFAALGGFLAADRERDAEAEVSYEQAVDAAEETEKSQAHRALASFYFARERFEEAEQTLQTALETTPEDLDLIYTLARFYNVRGESAKADAMIEAATEARPDEVRPYLVLSAYRGRKGDPHGALEAAEAALEVDPQDKAARLRKAELLVDLGHREQEATQIAQGKGIVEAVLAGEPSNPEALFVKAKINLAEGQPDEAAGQLRRAIDGRPDWGQAHFLLGSALFLQGDRNGSRAELLRALEIDPDLVEARRVLIRIHSQLGENDQAVAEGERILREAPRDHKTRILLAQALVRVSRPEDALEQLGSIPENERDAEAHYAIGRVHMLAGRQDEAKVSLESAFALAPYHPEVLRSLMTLDLREGERERAIARITAAVEANPKDSRLLQLQGNVLMMSGQLPEAERTFQRAIEQNPNDLAAYESLARYFMLSGRGKEVLSTYEKALGENPEVATLHLVVGSLYELNSRKQDAIERYEEAIRLNPNLAPAKNNLAYLFAESETNLDRALDLAQEAKALLPDNPSAADTLGWVLFKKNIPEAAIGYLKEAEGGFPPESAEIGVVRHHLAQAYESAGEIVKAREALERALADIDAYRKARSAQGSPEEVPEPAWTGDVRAMLDRLSAAEG